MKRVPFTTTVKLKVYKKCNFTCQKCGVAWDDNIEFHIHHKDKNPLNNALENLVWLCLNCHYLAHHKEDLDKKVRNWKYKISSY